MGDLEKSPGLLACSLEFCLALQGRKSGQAGTLLFAVLFAFISSQAARTRFFFIANTWLDLWHKQEEPSQLHSAF